MSWGYSIEIHEYKLFLIHLERVVRCKRRLALIWNPVHLDRIGQIGTAQYILVHTST
jgi:hypothetical protein